MPSLVMTLPEQAFLLMQLPVRPHTIPDFPLLCKENTVTERELKMTFRHRIGQLNVTAVEMVSIVSRDYHSLC